MDRLRALDQTIGSRAGADGARGSGTSVRRRNRAGRRQVSRCQAGCRASRPLAMICRGQKNRRHWRRLAGDCGGASRAGANRSTIASTCTATPKPRRMRRCCASCAARKQMAPRWCSSSPAREPEEATAMRRPSAAFSSDRCRCGSRRRNFAPLSSDSRTRISVMAGKGRCTCDCAEAGETGP